MQIFPAFSWKQFVLGKVASLKCLSTLCSVNCQKKKVDVLDKIPQAVSVSVRFKCVFY